MLSPPVRLKNCQVVWLAMRVFVLFLEKKEKDKELKELKKDYNEFARVYAKNRNQIINNTYNNSFNNKQYTGCVVCEPRALGGTRGLILSTCFICILDHRKNIGPLKKLELKKMHEQRS